MDEQFFDAPGFFLDRHNVDELAQLRRSGRADEKFQLIASIETSTIDKVIHFTRITRQIIEVSLIGAETNLVGTVEDHFSDGISVYSSQIRRLCYIPRRRISSISYRGDFILPIDFQVEPNPMWIYISNQFLDQQVTVFSWGKLHKGLILGVGDEILTMKVQGRFDRTAIRIRDIDRLEV